jgi:hypothetical protein
MRARPALGHGLAYPIAAGNNAAANLLLLSYAQAYIYIQIADSLLGTHYGIAPTQSGGGNGIPLSANWVPYRGETLGADRATADRYATLCA